MGHLANFDLPHHSGRTFEVHRRGDFSVRSVYAELEKILRGAPFVQSERLRRFLRLAVEEVLQGRGRQLKEYLIGVEVFDRNDTYDPRTDPIVRVEAHRLRSKLAEYYRTEGREDHVLIDIPKGTYVPVFRKRELKALRPSEMGSSPSKPRSLNECRTIAVLPFTDLSQENDQEYFCRGIAEDLITALTRLDGLRVVSRTSAFQFRSKTYDPRTIARRLNAVTVLEGTVQKVAKRVRVTAQLTSVPDGYHLWSERYDREVQDTKDVFPIQDEITKAIVKKLRATLVGQQNSAPFETICLPCSRQS